MSEERKSVVWITKNGKHIPIYADQVSNDERKKDREIRQNETEAESKNDGYIDDLDYDSFVEKNLEKLKAKYKADRDFEPKNEWRRYRWAQEKKYLHELKDVGEAIDKINESIPQRIQEGWFRSANSDYKPILVDYLLTSPGALNAALNIAYHNYCWQFGRYSDWQGKWIWDDDKDQSKRLSFKDWLHTEQTMYRGHRGQKTVKSDLFSAYTPDKRIAQKFMGYEDTGKLEEISIRPIDTLGNYRTNAETEFLVPSSELRKRGK